MKYRYEEHFRRVVAWFGVGRMIIHFFESSFSQVSVLLLIYFFISFWCYIQSPNQQRWPLPSLMSDSSSMLTLNIFSPFTPNKFGLFIASSKVFRVMFFICSSQKYCLISALYSTIQHNMLAIFKFSIFGVIELVNDKCSVSEAVGSSLGPCISRHFNNRQPYITPNLQRGAASPSKRLCS